MTKIHRGLSGVVVDETELSGVDGLRGRLWIRGHPIASLAGRFSFEAVVGLLQTGELASDTPVRQHLASERVRAFARLGDLGTALETDDGMDALRGALGALPADIDPIAAVAVYAAAWSRLRRGQVPTPPDPDRTHAADLLRMSLGVSDLACVRALDAYLVAVVDHGFNASTFAARVVASTGSDRVSAVVAGLGALKGPLHGGAPGPVLDMLDAIEGGRPEDWLRAELDAGRRIMGMGHRVYRVRDPRAQVLEAAMSGLPASPRLALAKRVEAAAESLLAARYPARRLKANVEFYTAILLEAVGFPRWIFASVFAAGRGAGWCAHVEEQRARGRLIRPQARYIGGRPEPSSRGGGPLDHL